MKNIGQRIKELRRKCDLTQEKLADYLGVTYQSVSKWETCVTYPDLSMIVPLAKLLGVTTDELLGVSEADTHLAELEDSYQSTFKTGGMDERIRITASAVKEYPADMLWLNRHAWDIWCVAIGTLPDGEEFEAEREKAIKMFDRVIGNTDDDEVKVNAIQGIVGCLCGKGCKDEARRYVKMFPDVKASPAVREELLGKCLEGDEQVRHKQKYLESQLGALIRYLIWNGVGENKYTCLSAKAIIDALIPDGNYCSYHYEMCHINFRLAEVAINDGDCEKAIELLREAVHCAKEFDIIDSVHPGEYKFTAPLFDKCTFDSQAWCHTAQGTLLDDIKEMSKRKAFDVIRDREDFRALFE